MQQTIKRFYKLADAAETEEGFAVELDGRPVRTPAKAALVLPSRALAEAIASEWQAQGEVIDPPTMPLNALACTALDIVAPKRAQVVADLVEHGGYDLICYWTDETDDLLRRQQDHWQPLLDWAGAELGAPLRKTAGIAPQEQPAESLAALGRAVEAHGDLELTALAAAVKAASSLIIGLALSHGRLDAVEAAALSQLDELYQAERWGEDAEAAARRAVLASEIAGAARFLDLVR